MHINILEIVVICVITGLAWWANEKLNQIPILKTVLQVIIVIVGVIWILQATGFMGGSTSSITVN